MDAYQWRAMQECIAAPEDEPYEVLERRLVDGAALKLEADTVEPIDIEERDPHGAGPVIGPEGDTRGDLGRHADRALAHDAALILDAPRRVLQPDVVEEFFQEGNAP